MIGIGAVLSTLAPAIGGVVGNIMGKGDRDRANQALNAALAKLQNIDLPPEEKLRIALERPEVQGILKPYMQKAEQITGTKMSDISVDPKFKEAQMKALDTLQQLGETGFTAEERAAQSQMRRKLAGDVAAQEAAMKQEMAARGIGGGAELASRLKAQQAGANIAAQQGEDLAARAEQRALQAILGGGQMAGQMRGQEFGEQAQVASAEDALARFNLQQRAAAQAANIGQLNRAQLQNLMEKQRVHEAGIAAQHTEEAQRARAAQQAFQNQFALAQAQANALKGQAAQAQKQAAATGKMWSGIGAGVGELGLAADKAGLFGSWGSGGAKATPASPIPQTEDWGAGEYFAGDEGPVGSGAVADYLRPFQSASAAGNKAILDAVKPKSKDGWTTKYGGYWDDEDE